MRDFASDFRVELRRHVGAQNKPPFGILPVELKQKRVLVYGPNLDRPIDCGLITDGARHVLWNPYRYDDVKNTPGLADHIEQEAARLMAAGEFVDAPPESYYQGGKPGGVASGDTRKASAIGG